jgi:hypothetical protein
MLVPGKRSREGEVFETTSFWRVISLAVKEG